MLTTTQFEERHPCDGAGEQSPWRLVCGVSLFADQHWQRHLLEQPFEQRPSRRGLCGQEYDSAYLQWALSQRVFTSTQVDLILAHASTAPNDRRFSVVCDCATLRNPASGVGTHVRKLAASA